MWAEKRGKERISETEQQNISAQEQEGSQVIKGMEAPGWKGSGINFAYCLNTR